MKILHICNDYCGSKVHANLYQHLDKLGVEQLVYAYYRGGDMEGKNHFEGKRTGFLYRPILKKRHCVLYHKKVQTVYDDLIHSVKDFHFDLAHATTLFNDGPIAYRLFREHDLPYVVTVRNTDINEFLGYATHTWVTGIKVLKAAKKIIFISKALKEKFCRHPVIRLHLKEIENKFVIQPNGIDAYWLENIKETPAEENHNVICVGRFDYNKNVMKLCQSILEMRNTFPDIQLHLVGGDGRYWGGKKTLHIRTRKQSFITARFTTKQS